MTHHCPDPVLRLDRKLDFSVQPILSGGLLTSLIFTSSLVALWFVDIATCLLFQSRVQRPFSRFWALLHSLVQQPKTGRLTLEGQPPVSVAVAEGHDASVTVARDLMVSQRAKEREVVE